MEQMIKMSMTCPEKEEKNILSENIQTVSSEALTDMIRRSYTFALGKKK